MAALLLPLTAEFCTPKTNRPIYVLLGLYVVTTIIVCALEFYAEPGALFQVRADVISSSPQYLAGLKLACSGSPFPAYQTQLPALIAAGSSITGWSYYPGFIAQALMQNALCSGCSSPFSISEKMKLSKERHNGIFIFSVTLCSSARFGACFASRTDTTCSTCSASITPSWAIGPLSSCISWSLPYLSSISVWALSNSQRRSQQFFSFSSSFLVWVTSNSTKRIDFSAPRPQS